MDFINLFLTDKCNKSCDFCFVQSKPRKNELSLEDFKNKVLPLLKKRKISGISLLGGEPTIYPHLPEIVDILKKEKIHFDIYSNGLFNIDLMNKVNLENVPISVHMPHTPQEEKKIIENLKYLRKRNTKVLFRDVIVEGYDFKKAYEFINKNKNLIHGIRYKIALPNLEKTNNYVKNIKLIKNKLIAFLKLIDKLNLEISNCCFLPLCAFTEEEIEFFRKVNYLSYCRRVFYIDTDLNIKMCPFHNQIFSDLNSLDKILEKKDTLKIPLSEKCSKCEKYLNNTCIPCFAYGENTEQDFEDFKTKIL